MVQTRNPFLSTVAARLRATRAPYASDTSVTVNTEILDGLPFRRVWFRTAGCTFDRQGLCTMCNYGFSEGIPATVTDDLRSSLRDVPIDPKSTLLVSPSGSMFDPREVPDEIRAAIFEVVAETAAGTVVCETRPETVTPKRMREFALAVAPKTGVIELGLESADEWVLQWCVNKRLDLEEFRQAVSICHDEGLRVLANVSLGTAFLTPAAAIRDAEFAVRWAMASGVDGCVVFPLNVREWTVLARLWRGGLYAPPSLWSLVEVLRKTAPDFPGAVTAAWYRDYNADLPQAAVSMPILASPTTCPRCLEQVISSLDAFRDTGDPRVLDVLSTLDCPCRDVWKKDSTDTTLDLGSVQRAYEYLGSSVLGPDWWTTHGSQVVCDLDAANSPR